jgi:hypothetical protein
MYFSAWPSGTLDILETDGLVAKLADAQDLGSCTRKGVSVRPRPRPPQFVAVLLILSAQVFGQQTPERFWVAGRYDGNRIVVYFDKVQFEGTMYPKAHEIASPVSDLFFSPVELPASYIAGFQNKPDSEHFAIGDRYDLMLGNGTIATVKLTSLVGCETDEEVGNDSFIGALGTVERPDALVFTNGYYAVRRHLEPQSDKQQSRPMTAADYRKYAGLIDTPIRFDTETQIAHLLDQRMKMEATAAEQRVAGGVAPALKVQTFQVADGSLRYYVRAEWKTGKEKGLQFPYSLAAWISPLPTLHILAVEQRTTGNDDLGLPDLHNVVDLGAGRTGIIIEVAYDASRELVLASYRDGVSVKGMRVLQSVGVGE